MPRPLLIGNGSLLVGLDSELSIRDLYWPYVGLFNHISGHRARIGIWVGGRFSWLSDSAWRRELTYRPDTLVTDVRATNDELGVFIRLSDAVMYDQDVLLRAITVCNLEDRAREVRLFFTHDLHIAETDIGDTAFYNPFLDAVIHYKWDNYFLVSGEGEECGLYQYAIGIAEFGGAEGTWRDCEDGELSMNAIAQGAVNSSISLRASLPPAGEGRFRAWSCAGESLEAVTELHKRTRAADAERLAEETEQYWRGWSDRESDRLRPHPERVRDLFRRSLLTIRANTDRRGAILAANDSDIMETARAHYSYMWPRDGALTAMAMDRLGYQSLTRRFFLFCQRVLPRDRALFHQKYSADGSWGSTWHPWVYAGKPEVPFQQDSTNLVLIALRHHCARYRDAAYLEQVYWELARPCADALEKHRDPNSGLPLPSYDLWEERRGVHAYTCGTLYGALLAAAELAESMSDDAAERYRAAADQVRAGMGEHLWDESAARFARRLIARQDGGYDRDLTIDSALHAVYAYGAFAAEDPRVESTMDAVLTRLRVQTDIGGYARYENDYYFRRSEDVDRIPGNPWVICTLWVAQWHIARSQTRADLDPALELLQWAVDRAMPSGVLPEQHDPETGDPLSVAPLTWSHAEYVATVLDYLDKWDSAAAAG